MEETVLLIAPLCISGNVDTPSIRGLLDILAMNLQTCNALSVKAPLFILEIADQHDHNNIMQRQLLTWPAQYDPEEIANLASQWEMPIDQILVPIVVEGKNSRELSLQVKLLNPTGEYQLYHGRWEGSLLDITKGLSDGSHSIISALGKTVRQHQEKWPNTDNEKALRLFLHAVNDINFFRAEIADGDFYDVLDALQEALRLDPGLELAVYRLLGFLEILIGNPFLPGRAYKVALKKLQQIEQRMSLSGSIHMLIAEIYKMIQDRPKMEYHLQQAIAKASLQEDIVVIVGNYFEQQEQWQQAQKIYENYLNHNQQPSYLILHNMAAIWAEQGQLGKAIDFWCQALRIKPDYSSAYGNLMNAYLENQEYDKMWVAFEQSLRYEPVIWQSYDHFFDRIAEIGDFTPAVEELRNYLDNHAQQTGGYFYLGLILKKQGKTAEAAATWRQGVTTSADLEFQNAIARQLLECHIEEFEKRFRDASEQVLAGEAREGLAFFQECTLTVPQFWPAWFFLSKAYQHLKMQPHSLEALEKARHLAPDNSIIWNELGLVSTLTNDHYYALHCFEHALTLAPFNADYLSNQALTFIKLGKIDKARDAIERALAIKPDDSISRNIKDLLDGKVVLNPDGSVRPRKKRRKRGRKSRKLWRFRHK